MRVDFFLGGSGYSARQLYAYPNFLIWFKPDERTAKWGKLFDALRQYWEENVK